MRYVAMLLLFTCWSTAAYSQSTQGSAERLVIPLCTVLSNPSDFEGKHISVKGNYRRIFHGAILSSSECPGQKVNVRFLPKLGGTKKDLKVLGKVADNHKSSDVVLRGTFRSAHEGQCFGQDCDPYEIEVIELLCVQLKQDDASCADKPHPEHFLLHEPGHVDGVHEKSER